MATGLLVATGSVAQPVEYTFFYPLQKVMDRFIPSSKQPQHWSRNYNGSQEQRKRLQASPESENNGLRSHKQGVTLKAEDLLREQRLTPVNFLAPRTGERRAALGGSATELTKYERPKAPLRRSSEGSYALRRKSSSSSNAADDPTSSDHSTSSPASSSSESGCNGDSEACSYCRLTESSCECPDSTDDERSSSSSSSSRDNPRRHRLIRALSEDCNPPSKVRRRSPGEYLRYKRDQMKKLRGERCNSPGCKTRIAFQRYDSEPRLHLPASEVPQPLSTFVSPTRHRIRQSHHRSLSEDPLIDHEADAKVEHDLRIGHEKRPLRAALPRNPRKSRSRERTRSKSVWTPSQDPTAPATFTCSVCECDIPFTNCVLCSAEAKAQFLSQKVENELSLHNTSAEGAGNEDPAADDKKELEEFYDGPTPVNSPRVKTPPERRRERWIAKGEVLQKSFNQEDLFAHRRKSLQLRKYNSEPVPDVKRELCSTSSSRNQPDRCRTSSEASKSEDSCSSSGRKSGFHVAKESPSKTQPDEESSQSSCQTCDTAVDEDQSTTQRETTQPDDKGTGKSPVFLKPEFVFEPEIIHKANPLVDEAEVDVLPSAREAFRRLSMEEYLSTVSIHEAAGKGDLHVVKLLCKRDCKQMETVDERGWTPIHLAAAHGHAEVVKYLASEGAHLSALDPSSYTALHLAAMNGHNSCVEVLLPMGVDVDSVTSEGFTPLHLAVMNGHLDCIQILLQWGSSLEKRDALGRGVYEMVEEYNLEEVAALLKSFHKQLHNFKHVLDLMQHRKEGRSPPEIPQEFIDILASIAEESGAE